MSSKVAFIGLGVMGYPMAGYISKAGHNVTVFNRTTSKADKWLKEYKGSKATTPAKACEGADFVFTCVGNDNDLREITFGDNGIFKTIKEGSVYIDNTTASATIAREIYDYSKKNNFDYLLIDTAGRLQNKKNLMDEFKKITTVVKKIDSTSPHETFLILDATTGQSAIDQVEEFKKITPITGIIMTKLDGTAKGGILLAISRKFKLPIIALGMGEKEDDLQTFNSEYFANALMHF